MVVASRALDGSVTDERHSQTRRLGAAAFRALARQVVPGATDTQCGFKFFAGPLARVRGGDDCLRGLQGMAQIMTGLDVRRVFHDEPDVLTWFDLSTSVADPVPVANWMHVEDGKITRIRVAFDARGIAGGS